MMQLSASLISEQLSDYITFRKYGDFPDALNLNRPEHYVQQNVLQRNHLYVASAVTLPDLLTGEPESCLICIGKPSEDYVAQSFSILCVSESLDIFRLFNMLQKIYDQYDLWDQQMQQCINAYSDLQDIVNVSDSIFQNPIYLCDSDYRILAGPRNDPQNIKYTYIPQRFINNFKYDPIYHKMWQSDVPIICQGDLRDDRHLCLIVRSQGQFAVFVSLIETNIPFRESDSILLQHMAYYVLLHFEQNLVSNENKSFSLEYFMKQYLNQQQISRQSFENALMLFNWKASHTFYLCYIELTESDLHYNTIKYQCDQIKNLLPSAVVFEYNNCIVAIVNRSLLSDSKAIEARLYAFLQNSNFKAGISRDFNTINNVRNYYIQAFSALELGANAASDMCYYKFEDYCLEYMLKNSYQNLIPESLCPNGLIEMREYDRAHNTQYIQTLKTYFEEKYNVTHAAKKMYIHRTTFIDRLERIKNFLGMNLEDSRTCFYLMIALEIMCEKGSAM
ncbi:PucR family transcriptional regulator [Pectinatus frisingensis]|uniref:PucR family transcriptional regulator n=1 Tax=Pectinatus frisingensis TaxID=865 RepID=UPI0018C5D0F2|nr:helix-turn-helix domain-containing protein [Pectinatus frisingensis]